MGVREYLFTNMHAHVHEYVRVCKISGFTPSYDALGRLLKKKKKKKNMMTKIRKSRMSDFSCEDTKVCLDS